MAQAVKPVKLTPADFKFGSTLLGEGSFSQVYLATRNIDGAKYAIKVVDKNFIRRMSKEHTVMNEKAVLQDFVIELAPNGDLGDFIKQHGALSRELAACYTAELTLVMEFMHSKGYIHRDLKPENILLSKGYHIKICDFGTAKLLEPEVAADAAGNAASSDDDDEFNRAGADEEEDADLRKARSRHGRRKNSFEGTAEYVSPEMINHTRAREPADMWALGCVLFHMLAAKPPFKGASEFLTFQKIIARDFTFPPSFPEDAKSLTDALLALDPKARPGGTPEGYAKMKQHPFFKDITWETLATSPLPLPAAVKVTLPPPTSTAGRARSPSPAPFPPVSASPIVSPMASPRPPDSKPHSTHAERVVASLGALGLDDADADARARESPPAGSFVLAAAHTPSNP